MDRQNAVVRSKLHFSPNLLNSIQNAIEATTVATIEYDSREKGITIRSVEPMAVIYKDGKRNMVAWCRLREDFRLFRLDRVNMIKLHNEVFEPNPEFNIESFEPEDDISRKDPNEDESRSDNS
ncbi:MAG: WYL domain-containing protein [Chitinophagales bacterium]|nr:WYL domain-containing protein [Chitinophagales bacterium]